MPESGAVYQPTTVGYAYDTRDGGGFRRICPRIIARHKFSTKDWIEYVLLTVAVGALIAGLVTLLFNTSTSAEDTVQQDVSSVPKDSSTEIKEHPEDKNKTSTVAGATLIILSVVLGCSWGYLKFFRRGKSPRSGMTSNSGQMLGGLNPSTDLLVGSTSQYGPVLTELPSQLKSSKIDETSTALPMSDQEEETHTLMDDAQSQQQTSTGPTTIAGQIPG